MSENNIWYLPGPFHRYEDDVKALAKKAGLRIVDANVTESRDGAAEDVPEVTIREDLLHVVQVVEDSSTDQCVINGLKAELAAVGVIVQSFAEQRLERPDGEIGEIADRLFQILESVNAGVDFLQRERDSEADKVATLQSQVDDLLQQIAKRDAETDASREAKAVAELKATLDAAGISYRSNASKESLEKQVSDLSKA